ncbi:MAG TPA: hypothetical protein VKQ52_15035, partial [Puia sp.]|nr:hypothetical protein [Puia sp.]
MKITGSTVFDILLRWRVYFQGNNALRDYHGGEPFRSELFSSEQMDRHGIVVAQSHKLMKRHSSDQLLGRLDGNEKTLLEVRSLLVENIRAGKPITPGAEWLLDNFYLIEEQVIIARKHLPKGYSEALPYLSQGMSHGMPRVYDIVLEIISHSDGRVDVKGLSSFIAAYQTYTPLTLGELWAIPIMLRLSVIENLRRVAGKIALDMIDRNMADYWADKMMETAKEEPGNLILTIADMVRSKPALVSPFVAAFTKKLQGKGPALALPLNWMEQQLSALKLNSADLVQQENQKQAADQVSVRNSIGTLRAIGATDWREFVESSSSVEQILRQDGAGIYPLMDFATRDSYRHVVESIAKASPLSETEVAAQVLALAGRPLPGGEGILPDAHSPAGKHAHVGYYLVDKGRIQTEKAACMRYTLRQKLARIAGRVPVLLYLSSVTLLTMLTAAGVLYPLYRYGPHHWLLLSVMALLSLSVSAQLAIPLVNWLSTLWIKPMLLPRMDFSTGIPARYRTLVVVPSMLSGTAYIAEMIEALEIRFLANKENNLYFGLLTDFTDAGSQVMPDDDALLDFASRRIQALNKKYSPEGQMGSGQGGSCQDIFFLFHRPRAWNRKERKWMGYERKRGKLFALNCLLRGRSPHEFSRITGNHRLLSGIKYIITLDSDTLLPRDSARAFIATMAHPLNHALYDPKKRRVT